MPKKYGQLTKRQVASTVLVPTQWNLFFMHSFSTYQAYTHLPFLYSFHATYSCHRLAPILCRVRVNVALAKRDKSKSAAREWQITTVLLKAFVFWCALNMMVWFYVLHFSHIHTHTHAHTHTSTHIHKYTHTYKHTHTHAHAH
jgi:hypothetical protein